MLFSNKNISEKANTFSSKLVIDLILSLRKQLIDFLILLYYFKLQIQITQ